MRRRLTICAVLVLCWNAVATTGAHAAVLASSFFTSGDEGWRSFSLADTPDPDFRTVLGGESPVAFDASNGNIAGSIERTDPDFGWQYFVAPQAFLGDQSAALGGSLTFQQQRRDALSLVPATPSALVGISDGAMVLVYANDAAAPATGAWTNYLVNFASSAEGWFVDSIHGAPANPGQLAGVLANLSKLWIAGEWFAGAIQDGSPETIALDNVILKGLDVTPAPVPVVGTVWLMLVAGLVFLPRQAAKRLSTV